MEQEFEGKDLEEIGCQSLRCGMTMGQLMLLLEILNIKYTEAQIEKIRDYRMHLQRVTRNQALGY